jgi:hypothetical protein
VRYEANIGLVNTHAKGNGGNDNNIVFPKKPSLVILPGLCIHAGMVWQCVHPFVLKPPRHLIRPFPGTSINDAGLCNMIVLNKIEQLFLAVGFQFDR